MATRRRPESPSGTAPHGLYRNFGDLFLPEIGQAAFCAGLPKAHEARGLYDALIRPVRKAVAATTLVIVRDGQLHLVPFDSLRGPSGRSIAESKTVLYSPSATTFYLLMQEKQRPRIAHRTLLAVGGIPYSRSSINRSALTRGNDGGRFVDLPSSSDEVGIARGALPGSDKKLLVASALLQRRRPSRQRVWANIR